jgi:glycosyltransferase involved in cell wall biosynthesis
MKIIQVQTQAEAAGAQRVSDMVGEGLRARGHEVRTVFMYRKTDVYDEDPFADFIQRTSPSGVLDQARAAMGLIGYLRAQRPEAVITYQYWGNLFGTVGGRLSGARVLVANQSGQPMRTGVLGIVSRLDRLMGHWGMYHYNVVNSAWTEEQFNTYSAAYRRRMRRIDHGVVRHEQAFAKDEARKSFALPMNVPLAISSGRQTEQKNFAVLVDVLGRLPELHLALAGRGPAQADLIKRAESLDVRERLHLVGELPPARIGAFLATGDVYAFPSLMETFGLAVAEAAIAGLPVVASDLEVLREVLRTEGGEPAALFTPPRDAAAFAQAIARVISERDLALHLRSAGRSLARRYSPTTMSNAYEALLVG